MVNYFGYFPRSNRAVGTPADQSKSSRTDFNRLIMAVRLEIPILLFHGAGLDSPCVARSPLKASSLAWYSYHIAAPTPGTDRNEWWG